MNLNLLLINSFYLVFTFYRNVKKSDTGQSYYNHGQNLWNNVEKSSKIGQDKKTLKSVFAYFLITSTKFLFAEGRLGTRLCLLPFFMSMIVDLFYPVWKETTRKPSKVSAAKGFFPNVDITDTTCFDEFFYSMWWLEGIIFIKVYHYFDVFSTTMLLLSSKQVFWKSLNLVLSPQ